MHVHFPLNCRWLLAAAALMMLVGCKNEEKQPSVWDQYDVRQPLPYDSQVPDSEVTKINRYDPYRYPPIDNDTYYQPPNSPAGYVYNPDGLD